MESDFLILVTFGDEKASSDEECDRPPLRAFKDLIDLLPRNIPKSFYKADKER